MPLRAPSPGRRTSSVSTAGSSSAAGRSGTLSDQISRTGFLQGTAWAATPIWKGDTGCVGNLSKSATGTLKDPVISDSGRAFLAGLLTQLSDDQITALFEVSRATLRLRDPEDVRSGFATVAEWVRVFKRKRAEIVDRQCG